MWKLPKLPKIQKSQKLAKPAKLLTLEVQTSIPSAIKTELVLVFQDSKKKAIFAKKFTPLFGTGEGLPEGIDGRYGSIHWIRTAGVVWRNWCVIGLGPIAELTEEKLRVVGGNVWARMVAEKARQAFVEASAFLDESGGGLEHLSAFLEGLILSAYEFKKYKSQGLSKGRNSDQSKSDSSLLVVVTSKPVVKKQLEARIDRLVAVQEAVKITRDWSNEPSNYGTPEYFAREAVGLAKRYGLKVKVLTMKDAAREKMGLFLGVAQGAVREARVVVVEYVPEKVQKGNGKKGAGKKYKTVALAGKGVTFDTGGVSIKPALHMEAMKHDMTGAATVMGAMVLAARWKIPNRVIGVMGFTENMPDGQAIQPGNILTARNGKTVEVINTDAEGRLVLGDILDYVQDYRPDVVVDVATLTGAVGIALGKYCCAVMGNKQSVITLLNRAAEIHGERIWQLPLYDEYFEDLKSDYADMRNVGNDSYGGAIRAAAFLKQFIREGVQWAHLDIAATSYSLSHLAYFPKRGASGSYVRTLAQFAMDF